MPYKLYEGDPTNDQEVFDFAVNHLLRQMCRSTDIAGFCLYRGEDGLMCGAGPFIKDYTEDMEGRPARALHCFKTGLYNIGLIDRLQSVHDSHGPEHWELLLKETAEVFKLNYNGIQ